MNHLHIMVCDDDPLDLAQTVEMIEKYDVNKRIQISSCMKAADLLALSVSTSYDIVLLDIEMESPNGYDIAKQIIQSHKSPVIIFVTKSSAYTLKGYGIALRYLQKPLRKVEFDEALDAAIQEATAHRLYFTSDDITIALPLREILFVEMYGHYAVVHTTTSEYRFRSTLNEIQAKLPRGYFALPHKSILVNFEHIRSASRSEIIMDNGALVPISRRKQQEFSKAFYRFLER